MNPDDVAGRLVADWLAEVSEHRVPDHLDGVLRQTRTAGQRPAWSFPGRWLPMQTTLRVASVPRAAWVLLVLVLIAALGVAVVAIGARPHQPPAPFGPARNGTIVYGAADGDIHGLDPATGATRVLVTGASADRNPAFSPDGSRFIFLRDTDVTDPIMSVPEPRIMIADADGAGERPLTGPLEQFGSAVWTHDGSAVVVAASIASSPGLQLIRADGSAAPLVIQTGGTVPLYTAIRPGDREITFRGSTPGGDGLYAVGIDGTGLRTIVARTEGDGASLSPDGTTLAYQVWDGTKGVIHLVAVDSGADTVPAFDPPSDASFVDGEPVWSPDGTRLLFSRYAMGIDNHLVVAPVSGGRRVQIGPAMPNSNSYTWAQFSPDGSKVLAYYAADGSSWLLDPSGSTADLQVAATNSDRLSWQRLAP